MVFIDVNKCDDVILFCVFLVQLLARGYLLGEIGSLIQSLPSLLCHIDIIYTIKSDFNISI